VERWWPSKAWETVRCSPYPKKLFAGTNNFFDALFSQQFPNLHGFVTICGLVMNQVSKPFAVARRVKLQTTPHKHPKSSHSMKLRDAASSRRSFLRRFETPGQAQPTERLRLVRVTEYDEGCRSKSRRSASGHVGKKAKKHTPLSSSPFHRTRVLQILQEAIGEGGKEVVGQI
jgi:hypothetical protein